MRFALYEPYTRLVSGLHDPSRFVGRCFLRIDGNVTRLSNGRLGDDLRLREVIPTVAALCARGAEIVMATHCSARGGEGTQEVAASALVAPVAEWFADRGYGTAQKVAWMENLYLEPYERQGDRAWAAGVASLYDFYVNDAFGSLHRGGASLVAMAHCFAPKRRTIGLLVERELRDLHRVIATLRRPVILLLGGAKRQKLEYLADFAQCADEILLAPALSTEYLAEAERYPAVRVPLDGVYYNRGSGCPLTIGPATVDAWSRLARMSGTLVVNGISGMDEVEGSHDPVMAVVREALENNVTVIAGGGSTMCIMHRYGVASRLAYGSTGGGSLLALLTGRQLPALDALITE